MIWSMNGAEERAFWLGPGVDERGYLVKIEKDTIMKKMK
jgi:hypothetical protein